MFVSCQMVGVGLWGEPRPSRAPWIPGVPGMSGERVGRLSVGCGLWETVGGSQTRPLQGSSRCRVFGSENGVGGRAAPRPMPRGHRVCPVCRGTGLVCLSVGRGCGTDVSGPSASLGKTIKGLGMTRGTQDGSERTFRMTVVRTVLSRHRGSGPVVSRTRSAVRGLGAASLVGK